MGATLTIGAALASAAARLAIHGSGRLDAELLLQHVLGWPRSRFYSAADAPLPRARQADFDALVDQRADGQPLAYLLGQCEFWSLELVVDPRVLVPRPDTELLVECALEATACTPTACLLDLGTGSGAIACALASERPAARIVASDRSLPALQVAALNFARHGKARIETVAGAWLAPFAADRFDVVVSNPPYVAAHERHLMNAATAFEPDEALFAADNGLAAIASIAADARRVLRKGGQLMVEHGLAQGAAVRALFARHGYVGITTRRDLAGHERVTEARG